MRRRRGYDAKGLVEAIMAKMDPDGTAEIRIVTGARSSGPTRCPACGAARQWLSQTADGRWQHVWCGWVEEPKPEEARP